MLERGAARSHWISLCIERTAEYKLVLRGCLFSDRVELTRQFVRTNFSTDRAPGGTFRAYNYHKRDRMQPSPFSRVCMYVCMYLHRKTFDRLWRPREKLWRLIKARNMSINSMNIFHKRNNTYFLAIYFCYIDENTFVPFLYVYIYIFLFFVIIIIFFSFTVCVVMHR